MKDGEMGNFQGFLFEESCHSVLNLLGYKELYSNRYNIDSISEPPSGSILRPGFSPSGITAFEFKSGFDYSDNEIKKLHEKINKLNPRFNIQGGVIIADMRLNDGSYKEGLQKNIFLWDIRDMCFLSSKIFLLNKMKTNSRVKEIELHDKITFFWAPHIKPLDITGKFHTADAVIFFHDPLLYVDEKILNITIEELHTILLKICSAASLLPLKVGVEIHSRGFLGKDAIRGVDKILTKYSTDKDISYSLKNLFTYYIGPWKTFLF